MVSNSAAPSLKKPRGPVRKARRIPRDPAPCFAQLLGSKQDGDWRPAQAFLAPPPSSAAATAVDWQPGEALESVPQSEGTLRPSWATQDGSAVAQAVPQSYNPSLLLWSAPCGQGCSPHGTSPGPSSGALSVGHFRQPIGAPGSWQPVVHRGTTGFAERVCCPGSGALGAFAQGQHGAATRLGYGTVRSHVWPSVAAAPLLDPLQPPIAGQEPFPASLWPETAQSREAEQIRAAEQSRDTPAHTPEEEPQESEASATRWLDGTGLSGAGPEGGRYLSGEDRAPEEPTEPVAVQARPEEEGTRRASRSGQNAWENRRGASTAAERARRAGWGQRSVYLQRGSGLVYPIDTMFGEGGVARFEESMSSALSDASSVTSADTVLSRPPPGGSRPGLHFSGGSARAQGGAFSFDQASDNLSVYSLATGDGNHSVMSYQDSQTLDYSMGPSSHARAPSRFWEVASLAAGAAVVLAGTATIISRSWDKGRATATGSPGAEASGSAQSHASARGDAPQGTKQGPGGSPPGVVPPGVVHGQEFIDDERPHLHRGCEGTFELFFRQQPGEDTSATQGSLAELKLEPFEEPKVKEGAGQTAPPTSIHESAKILLGTNEGSEKYCDLTKDLPCTDLSHPGCCIRGPGVIYEVKPGDTLCGIATRHGKTWNDIARTNPHIKNPDKIYPKDRLLL